VVFSKPTSVELHKCLLGSGSIANRAAGYGPVDKSVRRINPWCDPVHGGTDR